MSQTACPRCGTPLPIEDALACPACGALVHGQRLEQLSAEARWQERFSAKRAVVLWEQCLELLPEESKQSSAIRAEIDRLAATPEPSMLDEQPGEIPAIRTETLAGAVWKTGLSMAISAAVYALIFDWKIAIGFVLLILVHEMGHVVANLYYKVPISAPIFIPFLGAVINLRLPPPNARIEAICAIAGPLAGAIGSIACLGWYFGDHAPLAMTLAWFGFTMNLFNMLPIPPLDGGRVAAAISPWIWIVGIAGVVAMLVGSFRGQADGGILLLVLIVAIPRIIQTLRRGGRSGPYYAIGRIVPVLMGAAYLLLLGALMGLRIYSQRHMTMSIF